jgi:hypothetical protein
MSKITGNEPVHSAISEQNAFYEQGIPIRLHIAAMLLAQNGINAVHNLETDAKLAIAKADALIAAYNSTPNPNAQNDGKV